MASMIKTSWCYCPSKSWQSRTYSFRISKITSRVEYVSRKIKLVRHHFQDQNPPHLFPAQHQRTSVVWSLGLKGRCSCFVQSQASDGDLPPVNTCCCFRVFSLYLFHLSFYFSLLFPVLHLLCLDVEQHLANQHDRLQDGEDITITITITMERANDVLN